MKKKIISLFIAGVLTAAMLSGCGNESNDVLKDDSGNTEAAATSGEETNPTIFYVPERGVTFHVSEEYQALGATFDGYNENLQGYPMVSLSYYYLPITDKLFDEIIAIPQEERTQEDEDKFYAQMAIHNKPLMDIVLVEASEYKDRIAKGDSLDDISGFSGTEEYTENDGYMYLVAIPENDTEGMEAEEKAQYEKCHAYMQTVKENLELSKVNLESTDMTEYMPSFTANTLDGTEVTAELFTKKELTVVNIWGTFCSPCIEEMPELAEWAKEMPDNVQMVGICADIEGEEDKEHLDLAKQISEKAGVQFTQIIANDDFKELLDGIIGFPTTIFVDQSGYIVGEPIVGADVPAYKQFVEDYFHE